MPVENAYFIAESVRGIPAPARVSERISALHGVRRVEVDPAAPLISVQYDSAGTSYDEIEHLLNTLGYQIAADASDIRVR